MRVRVLVSSLLALSLVGVAQAAPASAVSDTTPPVLHSVSLASPGPFTAGDTVTVQWDATDDVAVKQVQVRYRDAAGKEHTVWANDAPSATTTVDYRWANGPVSIDFVVVMDVNNNLAWYYPNGLLQLSPGGQSTHTVDLSAAAFTTQGTGADLTPPVLNGVSLATPGPFTAGDTVTIVVDATDDAHGIAFTDIAVVDGAGKTHGFQASAGFTSLSRVIDASWGNGTVTLVNVSLEDGAGNRSLYKPDGTATYLPDGSGPPTHTVPLSSVTFTTHDTGADTTAPVLSAIALDGPGPFVEGDTVGLHWTATDDSGVQRVSISVLDSAGKYHGFFASGGATSASSVVDTSWAVGTATVSYVMLEDSWGNSAEYFSTGGVVTRPAGGPTSHTLDFSALSFQVQGQPQAAVTGGPPATSRASSSQFSFSLTDRDTPVDQLSVGCSLDATPLACTSSGAWADGLATGRHRLDVRVADPQGHGSSTSYGWTVDVTVPTAVAVAPTTPLTLATYPLLAWRGSDTGTGVASYDLRFTSASPGGGFTAWSTPSAWQHLTATSRVSPAVPAGTTLCFGVRARDVAGNVGAWSATRCVAHALDDRALGVSRGWSRPVASYLYGGSALRSTTYGATASYPSATLRRLGVVATTCPTCGEVGLYVAGRLVGRISLVSSSLVNRRVLLLPAFSLRSGALTVRVLTSGRSVVLDGLAVSRV